MALPHADSQEDLAEADITISKEVLFGAELLLLHASPVYYGLGIPRGDGSAVVLVPGFLGTDSYLTQLRGWLGRIGYRAYLSGIGLNADCPNLLIQRRLNENMEKALMETGRKIHLIGHSLGGIIARSVRQSEARRHRVVDYARFTVPRHRGPSRRRARPQANPRGARARSAAPLATPGAAPAISSIPSVARYPVP